MTTTKLLREHHQALRYALCEARRQFELGNRAGLDAWVRNVLAHLIVEETIFRPTLAERLPASALDDSYNRACLVRQLKLLAFGPTVSPPLFEQVERQFETHIYLEETNLFTEIERLFTAPELDISRQDVEWFYAHARSLPVATLFERVSMTLPVGASRAA